MALNTVRNYEDGITSPELPKLGRIAEALGVTAGWLIDGDREKEVV